MLHQTLTQPVRWARIAQGRTLDSGEGDVPQGAEMLALHVPALIIGLNLPPHRPAQRDALVRNVLASRGMDAGWQLAQCVAEGDTWRCVLISTATQAEIAAIRKTRSVATVYPLGASLPANHGMALPDRQLLRGEGIDVGSCQTMPPCPMLDWAISLTAFDGWADWAILQDKPRPQIDLAWRPLAWAALAVLLAMAANNLVGTFLAQRAASRADEALTRAFVSAHPKAAVVDPLLQLQAEAGGGIMPKLALALDALAPIDSVTAIEATPGGLRLTLSQPLNPAQAARAAQLLGEFETASKPDGVHISWRWKP